MPVFCPVGAATWVFFLVFGFLFVVWWVFCGFGWMFFLIVFCGILWIFVFLVGSFLGGRRVFCLAFVWLVFWLEKKVFKFLFVRKKKGLISAQTMCIQIAPGQERFFAVVATAVVPHPLLCHSSSSRTGSSLVESSSNRNSRRRIPRGIMEKGK